MWGRRVKTMRARLLPHELPAAIIRAPLHAPKSTRSRVSKHFWVMARKGENPRNASGYRAMA